MLLTEGTYRPINPNKHTFFAKKLKKPYLWFLVIHLHITNSVVCSLFFLSNPYTNDMNELNK